MNSLPQLAFSKIWQDKITGSKTRFPGHLYQTIVKNIHRIQPIDQMNTLATFPVGMACSQHTNSSLAHNDQVKLRNIRWKMDSCKDSEMLVLMWSDASLLTLIFKLHIL